jgi:hypothetical protein|tara:strand:- start:3324 stop:3758 length:435 start_codon:yes stop_codon:yes gene_type:complete
MINDGFNLKGKVEVRLNDEVVREIDNIVVTAGKNFVAASMIKTTSNSPAAMTHMAIGSNTTNPAAGDTALGTELGRVALTSGTVSSAVVTYVATFPAGTGTGAVVEAGILNASSGGTLLCHTEFDVVNKGSADAITITWTVTVS